MTVSTDGGRGRTFALAASVALLLLGALALVWVLSTQQGDPPAPDGSAGLSQAQEGATSAPEGAERTAPPDATTGTQDAPDASATTAEPTPSAAAAPEEPQIEAMPRSEPVSIDIPSIDVTSKLHPLGLNGDGTLEVPSGELYEQAAWYDGSPTPGELGPSVIEGHVTSKGSIPSIFFDLGVLDRGDTVQVTREDGSVATFEVYATDSFPKDDFPKVAVYGNTDVPELRLITCGGDYDPEVRAHVDNIVVFAKLVEQA